MQSFEEYFQNPENWTPELFREKPAQEYIRARLSNPWWRINNLYHIRDEAGNLVKFRLRDMQKDFLMALHGRDILLKARQGGFTTSIDIFFLDRALFNPSVHVGISAHKREDAEKIFREKITTPYENLPALIRAQVTAEIAKAGEIEFSNNSLIRVAVSLRSGTYQCVHISEYGPLCAEFPKKAEEVKTGTLNTAHEGSIVVIESTARGAAGEYYRMTQEAKQRMEIKDPLQWNEWKFHFSAWWKDPKYRLSAPENWQETKEQATYFDMVERGMSCSISRDQRFWYWSKAKEQGKKMKQEFPSTPEEAFLHSGAGVFNRENLTALKGETYSPRARYTVMPTGMMKLDPHGELFIYEPPQTNKVYALGADVAEGIVESDDTDSSSCDVLDQYGNQVAHFNGKVAPGFYGVILNAIGRHYNSGFLIVERNNHGHTTLDRLVQLKYPALYVEERKNQKGAKSTKKYGWGTDSVSKTLMIDQLVEDVEGESPALQIANGQTLGEMFTYVVDEKGSYNALPGSHDDRVISLALANQARRRLGVFIRRRQQELMNRNSSVPMGTPADQTTGW